MLQGWGDGSGAHPRHSVSAGGGQGEGEYVRTYVCMVHGACEGRCASVRVVCVCG